MKKLLAIVLVLTLAISMSVSAMATPNSVDDAEALIEWTAMDSANDGVFNPADLLPDIQDMVDDDAIDNFEALESMDIDFGRRHIRTTTETFQSWGGTDDGGPLVAGVPTPPAQPMWERAGALIISSDDWEVTVEIYDFYIGGVPGAANLTMVGFELTLTPNTLPMGNVVGDPSGTVHVPTTSTFNMLTVSDLDVGASDEIANGGIGFFGGNWQGALEVVGGTAINSLGQQAVAIMDWNFQYA